MNTVESDTREPFRRKLMLVCLVVSLVAAAWWWFRVVEIRSAESHRSMLALELVLRYYAIDHDGRLPKGWEPLFDGYCRKDPDGGVVVPLHAEHQTGNEHQVILTRPEWFDVAWGIDLRKTTDNGTLVEGGRLIVEPSTAAPPGTRLNCMCLSKVLCMAFRPSIRSASGSSPS